MVYSALTAWLVVMKSLSVFGSPGESSMEWFGLAVPVPGCGVEVQSVSGEPKEMVLYFSIDYCSYGGHLVIKEYILALFLGCLDIG